MTPDEMLAQAADVWRQAALDNVPQFRARAWCPASVRRRCAMTALAPPLRARLCMLGRLWRCEAGCDKFAFAAAGAAMHLNDYHAWTWIDFASKFSEVWAEGERRAAGR